MREEFKKNVSPLSRTWFVGVPISWVGGIVLFVRQCFAGRVLRLTSCCHKRQCAQILFLEKRLPPYLRGVVSLVCRMMDAEGSERKNVSPLSGIRLSILSSLFFIPWVFWFGPLVRS